MPDIQVKSYVRTRPQMIAYLTRKYRRQYRLKGLPFTNKVRRLIRRGVRTHYAPKPITFTMKMEIL